LSACVMMDKTVIYYCVFYECVSEWWIVFMPGVYHNGGHGRDWCGG